MLGAFSDDTTAATTTITNTSDPFRGGPLLSRYGRRTSTRGLLQKKKKKRPLHKTIIKNNGYRISMEVGGGTGRAFSRLPSSQTHYYYTTSPLFPKGATTCSVASHTVLSERDVARRGSCRCPPGGRAARVSARKAVSRRPCAPASLRQRADRIANRPRFRSRGRTGFPPVSTELHARAFDAEEQ